MREREREREREEERDTDLHSHSVNFFHHSRWVFPALRIKLLIAQHCPRIVINHDHRHRYVPLAVARCYWQQLGLVAVAVATLPKASRPVRVDGRVSGDVHVVTHQVCPWRWSGVSILALLRDVLWKRSKNWLTVVGVERRQVSALRCGRRGHPEVELQSCFGEPLGKRVWALLLGVRIPNMWSASVLFQTEKATGVKPKGITGFIQQFTPVSVFKVCPEVHKPKLIELFWHVAFSSQLYPARDVSMIADCPKRTNLFQVDHCSGLILLALCVLPILVCLKQSFHFPWPHHLTPFLVPRCNCPIHWRCRMPLLFSFSVNNFFMMVWFGDLVWVGQTVLTCAVREVLSKETLPKEGTFHK